MVADLEFDSLLDVAEGPARATRDVKFSRDDVSVSVTVRSDAATCTFAAEALVRPGDTFDVSARHIDGRAIAAEWHAGDRATLTGVPEGFVSFYFRSRDERIPSWRTAWLQY